MHKTLDGTKSTLTEFIRVFFEAEDILYQKLDLIDHTLEEYRGNHSDALQGLEESRNTERLNQYGIMDGSTLDVTVHTLEGLNDLTRKAPNGLLRVVLVCEGQTLKTNPVQGTFGNTVWNEEFTFGIKTGMEDLQLRIVLSDRSLSSEETIGQTRIPLSRLRDQQAKEDGFELMDKNGLVTNGKILLTLQWIYSKVKFLTDAVTKWDKLIADQIEDKKEYEQDILTLYDPFPELRTSCPKQLDLKAFDHHPDVHANQLNPLFSNASVIPTPAQKMAIVLSYFFGIFALAANIFKTDYFAVRLESCGC